MNNTEFLTHILELCEKNMPEGEYLRAANMLRDNHNKIPIVNESEEEEIIYSRPLSISIRDVDDDGILNDFQVVGHSQKNVRYSATDSRIARIPQHFICEQNNIRFIIKCDDTENHHSIFKFRSVFLKKYIKVFLKRHLALCVYISASQNNIIHENIEFSKFYKFYKKKIDMYNDNIDSEDYEDKWSCNLDDSYNEYLEFVIEIFINDLETRQNYNQ